MQGAILKSFTYSNEGGNGAGVIILDEYLDDEDKQRIAAKIGLSETVFVKQNSINNYDISFFTPVCEVDLCGHGTIAAFYYLGITGIIEGTSQLIKVFQNTKVGKLEVEIEFKDKIVENVMMEMASPKIFHELNEIKRNEVALSLNIEEKNIGLSCSNIEPTVVSTGLKDLLIPVKTREILNSIKPNFDIINKISADNDVVGYHVYTIDNHIIYARNFAPLVGINEECATGTSNGALGFLLHKKGIISGYAEIIQGEAMGQTSLIIVKIYEQGDKFDVRVGGKALVIKNIKL